MSSYTPTYDDPACRRGVQGIHTLYRVLRENEDPTKGLFPKAPFAHHSPQQHVAFGSWTPTQFISTSKDPESALRWICKARNPNGRKVVKIHVNPELRSRLVDLSCGQNLTGVTARNFAKSAKEVLIEGPVPPELIEVMVSHRPSLPECGDIETNYKAHQQLKNGYIRMHHSGGGFIHQRGNRARHLVSGEGFWDKLKSGAKKVGSTAWQGVKLASAASDAQDAIKDKNPLKLSRAIKSYTGEKQNSLEDADELLENYS